MSVQVEAVHFVPGFFTRGDSELCAGKGLVVGGALLNLVSDHRRMLT